MIKFIEGDLRTITNHALLVQQVNCQGVVTNGIFKTLAYKWPQLPVEYKAYIANAEACGKARKNLLGHVNYVDLPNSCHICNIFGQLGYGATKKHYTHEDMLLFGLRSVLLTAQKYNLDVFIPAQIGEGVNGGDHQIITAGIFDLATHFPEITINIVKYKRNQPIQEQPDTSKIFAEMFFN